MLKTQCFCVKRLSWQCFKTIFNKEFRKNVTILKRRDRELFVIQTSVNKLLKTLNYLEIIPKKFHAPKWINNLNLFGAYLAGLIDGDGDVRIRRKNYPQCAIRITKGVKDIILIDQIKNFLNCNVSCYHVTTKSILNGRKIIGRAFRIEFLVSSKNKELFKLYLLPFLRIVHKKQIIFNYLAN